MPSCIVPFSLSHRDWVGIFIVSCLKNSQFVIYVHRIQFSSARSRKVSSTGKILQLIFSSFMADKVNIPLWHTQSYNSYTPLKRILEQWKSAYNRQWISVPSRRFCQRFQKGFHTKAKFLLLHHSWNPDLEVQVPASRLKSQPRGSNPSLEA